MGEVEQQHETQHTNWISTRRIIRSNDLVITTMSPLQNPFRSVRTTQITIRRGNAPKMNLNDFFQKCGYSLL